MKKFHFEIFVTISWIKQFPAFFDLLTINDVYLTNTLQLSIWPPKM